MHPPCSFSIIDSVQLPITKFQRRNSLWMI
nr:MAG TPA: hypothetical protein [Caudoviricetes sp.]DAM63881.1 MAG TPA: hypothetical protein [Caudoviricetes sp.]DAT66843.1 MAG TPA: hypothetical protein [Caudoviricetes sp.]